jgi:FAD/FMN-containing dehydrogenase
VATAFESLEHERRKERVARRLRQTSGLLRSRKKTTSNLFRYQFRPTHSGSKIDLRRFNHVLDIDRAALIIDVEGSTTYEQIVSRTLEASLLPAVTPELKHITIGGAIVGIGIESTCFKHGFVHDGLLEADVLLPEGDIVRCSAGNAHGDLFRALPNSYGTLGYVLKARMRLIPAKPYVSLTNVVFKDISKYVLAMRAAAESGDFDFVEGLIYSNQELHLTTGAFIENPDGPVFDIYGPSIYYSALRVSERLCLRTENYIFRFDPDWFWNIPDSRLYRLFRRVAPRGLRSSKFYNRYVRWTDAARRAIGLPDSDREEQVIQDWQLHWSQSEWFTRLVMNTLPLNGRPCVVVPIRPQSSPTLYPVNTQHWYYNLGCYCFVGKPKTQRKHEYTRILDRECFASGGIKMLYSSTFLDQEAFNRVYNGGAYQALKAKYDPNGRLPTLYAKAVLAQ